METECHSRFPNQSVVKLKTRTLICLYADDVSFSAGSLSPKPHEQGLEEDSENPALTVVPGSSESMSGVSQYRDFISCLPGHLSKAILGNPARGRGL